MDIKCPPNTLKTFLEWEVKSQTMSLFLLHPIHGEILGRFIGSLILYTLLLIFVT
jgi:hypothetical protein